jgi:osmotically-inducible protein OsmY
MCDPLTAAIAIAAVSTGVQAIAGNQLASATNKALENQNRVRKEEIDKATTAEINDRLREKRREQGRILVAAGESGLSLTSGGVEALLLDSEMQAKLANDRSLANRESRKKASDAETLANMQSKTSALGAGLQIGLAAGNAYFANKSTPPKPTKKTN